MLGRLVWAVDDRACGVRLVVPCHWIPVNGCMRNSCAALFPVPCVASAGTVAGRVFPQGARAGRATYNRFWKTQRLQNLISAICEIDLGGCSCPFSEQEAPVGRKNPIRWNFGQAFATARRWCDSPKSPHGSFLKREFAAGWNFCALQVNAPIGIQSAPRLTRATAP